MFEIEVPKGQTPEGKTEKIDLKEVKKNAGLSDIFAEFAGDSETTALLEDMLTRMATTDYDPMKEWSGFSDPEERFRDWGPAPQKRISPDIPPPKNPVEPKSYWAIKREEEAAEKLARAERNKVDWSMLQVGDSIELPDPAVGPTKVTLKSWKKLNNVPNFDITFEKIGNKSYRVTRVS
jgi:hypothetical protein